MKKRIILVKTEKEKKCYSTLFSALGLDYEYVMVK